MRRAAVKLKSFLRRNGDIGNCAHLYGACRHIRAYFPSVVVQAQATSDVRSRDPDGWMRRTGRGSSPLPDPSRALCVTIHQQALRPGTGARHLQEGLSNAPKATAPRKQLGS